MELTLRRLNEKGIEIFLGYLQEGAKEDIPLEIISDPLSSEPLSNEINVDIDSHFQNRFEFGEYLVKLLMPLDDGTLELDRGLWSALAIIWFNQICPPTSTGHRKVGKEYRYVLSSDYRHHYRHLIRSPWQLVRDHQEYSKFLLLPPKETPYPLMRHGEILEQLGGRQAVLRSNRIVSEASHLFSDPKTGKPVAGVSGNGRGSARRLGLVLRQLDLTYDAGSMKVGALIDVLPREFDRWKKGN